MTKDTKDFTPIPTTHEEVLEQLHAFMGFCRERGLPAMIGIGYGEGVMTVQGGITKDRSHIISTLAAQHTNELLSGMYQQPSTAAMQESKQTVH